jgi:hypothetical protein
LNPRAIRNAGCPTRIITIPLEARAGFLGLTWLAFSLILYISAYLVDIGSAEFIRLIAMDLSGPNWRSSRLPSGRPRRWSRGTTPRTNPCRGLLGAHRRCGPCWPHSWLPGGMPRPCEASAVSTRASWRSSSSARSRHPRRRATAPLQQPFKWLNDEGEIEGSSMIRMRPPKLREAGSRPRRSPARGRSVAVARQDGPAYER